MLLNSGPNVGLQLPQYLYPTELANAPYDLATNQLTLGAGDALPIPNGRWLIDLGEFSFLQVLDPVTGIWRTTANAAQRVSPIVVYADGFTRRIANLTGCPVGAVVAGGGSGFAQATATLSASVGGSTWQPIVGGSLSVSTVSAAGGGYTETPLVFIPAPPNPGIQATAQAILTSGSVSAVSLTNFGAGYLTAPTGVILPNPTDTSTTITQATVTFVLSAANAGAITGALCTNPGAALSTANLTGMSLTAAGGAGSGATITPVVMQCVTGTSVVAGGVGLGSATDPALITSVGGIPRSVAAVSLSDPIVDLTNFRPRAFVGSGTSNAGGTLSAITIIDHGLFVGTPTPVVALGAGGSIAAMGAPSITFTMGSTIDTVMIQPL